MRKNNFFFPASKIKAAAFFISVFVLFNFTFFPISAAFFSETVKKDVFAVSESFSKTLENVNNLICGKSIFKLSIDCFKNEKTAKTFRVLSFAFSPLQVFSNKAAGKIAVLCDFLKSAPLKHSLQIPYPPPDFARNVFYFAAMLLFFASIRNPNGDFSFIAKFSKSPLLV